MYRRQRFAVMTSTGFAYGASPSLLSTRARLSSAPAASRSPSPEELIGGSSTACPRSLDSPLTDFTRLALALSASLSRRALLAAATVEGSIDLMPPVGR